MWLLSLLPMWALYLISDVLYFLLRHVFAYRKEVVESNLRHAFPDWDTEQLAAETNKYYKHLADIMVETVKLGSASSGFIERRCSFKNPDVFNDLVARGQSFLIIMGHTGNWEWAGASTKLHFPLNMQAIYRPLSNKAIDHYYRWLRSRFGSRPVAMSDAFEAIASCSAVCATAFIADQAASPEKALWTYFLNRPAAVFRGIEVIARKTNQPVVFANLLKTGRGFYTIELELLSENPAATDKGEITRRHVRRLEECIRQQPFNWLWSHKRWKHQPPGRATWID